jgi:hypothetical protein
MERIPKLIAIDHDDYTARHVGHTSDGRQFFLTSPFVPAGTSDAPAGREFLALYVFDEHGSLVEAFIDDLGSRSSLDEAHAVRRRNEHLTSLGQITFDRIEIAPFTVERFGVEFGFIPQEPDDPEDDWSIVAEPGNYMCFWPPWDSGEYDT